MFFFFIVFWCRAVTALNGRFGVLSSNSRLVGFNSRFVTIWQQHEKIAVPASV
jgi:hypothetical protein